MNCKDIKVGHHYKLEIWEGEPNYLQCTGLDDGWFEMSSFHMDEPMLIMDTDQEMTLEEITHDEYHKWEAVWNWKYKDK
jgi:hypothetical protein